MQKRLKTKPKKVSAYMSSHELFWCERACMLSYFSHVQLSATLLTAVCQAPLSMEFSRQEYQSGLSCPPSGDLPDTRIEPSSLTSPALASRFFTTSTTWKARY